MKNLKFHDATIKPPKMDRMLEPMHHEMEPYNQSIGLSEDQLPEIKGWETGEEYTLVLKVKQTGNHLRSNPGEDPDKPQHLSADFDILEVAGYYEGESKDE